MYILIGSRETTWHWTCSSKTCYLSFGLKETKFPWKLIHLLKKIALPKWRNFIFIASKWRNPLAAYWRTQSGAPFSVRGKCGNVSQGNMHILCTTVWFAALFFIDDTVDPKLHFFVDEKESYLDSNTCTTELKKIAVATYIQDGPKNQI